MTITIELPDELAQRLRADAEAQGRDVTAVAFDAVAAVYADDAVQDVSRAGTREQAHPLRPFSEYPSEEAYIAAAIEGARAYGFDPDTCAGIAQGIADADAGRTLSLEEALAELEAHKATWRQQHASASRG